MQMLGKSFAEGLGVWMVELSVLLQDSWWCRLKRQINVLGQSPVATSHF